MIFKDVRKTIGIQKNIQSNIKNLIKLNLEERFEGHKNGAYKNVFPVSVSPGMIVLLYETIFNLKSQYIYKVRNFTADQY
mmetsp:Transcript_18252/g.28066  ORF Transcript_18252/g.28066 Transcript_18252/m.28066 type:complete len:80 (+) Transcript_18252:132-371(+)